jgi:hypothetical protein
MPRFTRGLRGACVGITDAAQRPEVKPRVLLAALCAVAVLPRAACAQPGLLLGVDDDSLKWYAHTSSLLTIYRSLDVDVVRVTLTWTPGESFPAGTDRTELQRAANAGRGIRIVLAVTGQAAVPPLEPAARASYCGFVANVLARYPAIHDVAIWTEPNSKPFWQPQRGAAAAYEALLATCWDTLHASAPGVNVIASSAPHAQPGDWYRALGKAYKASARATPIFDTVGHNAYPNNSAEPPAATHKKRSIDEGDLPRLLKVLHTAFAGTGQPLPGEHGVTVWYLEDGFQSQEPYTGTETDKKPVSEAEQAAQLTAAIELAYCQPAVGAFFNFELRDDTDLGGWQSGLVRPDWSAKAAFTAFARVARAVHDRTIACPS